MSARCMAAVFDRYPSGGGEYALALALADNAHDDGTHIFPGMELMAHKSRQDERSVQRHLKAMQASCWLLLVRRGVRGRPNEYRINPAWLRGDSLSPKAPAPLDPERDDKLSPHSPAKGVTNDAERGDKRSTPYKNRRNLIPPNPPAGGAPGSTAPDAGEPGSGFDAVAAGYPRRAGIEAARRVWTELAPDAHLQAEIARAIQAWIPSAEWQREGGRFIPKFASFLRNRRWLDAPGSTAPPPSPMPEPAPVLTPEQLAANRVRAREAAALARSMFHGKREAATC